MAALPKPEIMSPAGYWPQLRAAIEAGADSVYFGLKHFTARAKVGFTLAELPQALTTLHRRGVKGFVTFNTLVFDHELDEAARALEAIAEAAADAIIVQDLGVLRMARRIAPDLPIHASTQMSVTNADGARLAERLGASRVTLARELSLAEIRAIRAAIGCELEIFVHGALCVAYSGQCFSSEAWGGRSANRGQCAQACRLPYEMLVDGNVAPLGDARYLLSPGDLFALRQIPEIVEIGISALKIEGRYKDADYVALVTRAYREAVDAAWAGRPLAVDPSRELQLEQVYSRGLAPHFLTGTNHQAVVNGRAPRHRGVLMGRVARVAGAAVTIEPSAAHAIAPLKPGDGVVFDAADWRTPEEAEEGGRVFEAAARGRRIEIRFANGALNPARIRPGDLVWRTADPQIEKAARPFTAPAAPVRKQRTDVRVKAREGQPLETEWRVGAASVEVRSAAPLGTARNAAVDVPLLREQFGRLGNTAYELGEVWLETEGQPFAPGSLLNQVRRDAVERLQDRQGARSAKGLAERPHGAALEEQPAPALPVEPREALAEGPGKLWLEKRRGEASARPATALAEVPDRALIEGLSKGLAEEPHGEVSAAGAGVPHEASAVRPGELLTEQPLAAWLVPPARRADREAAPTLDLLVRDSAQLEAALAARPAGITLDYLDLYGLRPSLERVRQAGIQVRVASPRVLKPGEERIVDFLLGCDCAILVRPAGLLEALRGRGSRELTGDFSLNAANALTARELLDMGLARLTPTHDLNAAQVAALARQIGGAAIEAVAYQHLPVFHTEHCVFCRFLSKGTSYKDCGRPCERHRVALKDAAGRAHPVVADVGCRNTVFGAEAQEAGAHLDAWLAAGIRRFRLEFAHESGEQVAQVTRAFEETLAGRKSPRELARVLQRTAPEGTTQGSLYVPDGYLTLPVLQ